MALAIPDGPADLTAEWLTDALGAAGVLRAPARVSRASALVIAADRGVGGQVARVTLEYAGTEGVEGGAGATLPPTLVAKLPSAVDLTRRGSRAVRLPEREVALYRELASELPLRAPRCYYADIAPDGDAFVLLLEDLGGYANGDDLEGVSVERLHAVARALARLHAAWWESPRLERLAWLPRIDARATMWERLFGSTWTEVRDRPAPVPGLELPAGSHEVLDVLAQVGSTLYTSLAAGPRTLLHGDMRLDNLFFDLPGAEVAAVDWSNATNGPGPYDLAYLCAIALPVEERRALEQALLESYVAELARAGYEVDERWARGAYALSYLEPAMRMVFLLARGDAGARGDRVHRILVQLVERSLAAAIDLDALSYLDGAPR